MLYIKMINSLILYQRFTMRIIYLLLTGLLFCHLDATSQDKNIAKLYYAHIDKELYLPDENIWFKIYVHNPYFLDSKSSNIYVDLVDENKKVLEHKVYLTYLSSINGQIKIPNNYKFSQVNLIIYQINDQNERFNYFQKEISVLNNALIKRKDEIVNSKNINNASLSVKENIINIQKDSNQIIVQIDNENKNLNEIFFSIKGQEDTLYAKSYIIGDKNKLTIRLPKQQFSTGYYLFSFCNSKREVIYQKWVYNLSSDHLLRPLISLDTLSFGKEGMNVWKISNLPNANLSISIADADIPTSNKNIVSELLFNGMNNHPLKNIGNYFTNNKAVNEIAIDSIINANQITPLSISTVNEDNQDKYLTLKGKIIKTTKRDVPLPKELNIIIGSPNKQSSIIQTPINLDSSFILNKLIFYDTVFAKGVLNKKEINNFKVVLNQDTSYNMPPFDFINELSPATYKFIENEKANNLNNNSIILDSLIKKFTLKQATVTSKPELKLDKLDKIYTFGLFSSGNAYRLNVSEDNFFQNNFDLGNYIISKIPGISYSNNFNTMMEFDASPFSWRGSPTSIYLDEIKVSWDVVRDIPRVNIGYIKIFRPIFFGDIQKGIGGAIVIYTKKHFDQPAQLNTKESQLLKGYFSSNYFLDEAMQIGEKSKQVNTTLYWDPYFVFYDDPIKDKIIRFPNNDFTKRFLIKIEGIDAKGQVLYFEKIIE
jgi:hypothetical protein